MVQLALRSHPVLSSLKGVQAIITSFLGPPPSLTLSAACKFNSIDLLDWIWETSCTSATARTSTWSIHNYLRSDRYYHRYQFNQVLLQAAESGNKDIVEWTFSHFSGCIASEEVIAVAARNGHQQVLDVLWANDAGRGGKYFKREVYFDYESTSHEWIPARPANGNAVTWGGAAIWNAIDEGHDGVVKWLYTYSQHGFGDAEVRSLIQLALTKENTELAVSMVPQGAEVFDYCRENPTPDIIEMMLASGNICSEDHKLAAWIVRDFSKRGRLDLIQQACQVCSPDTDEVLLIAWELGLGEASIVGDLATVRWLTEHPLGRELLGRATESAASIIINRAALHFQFEVMQYLCEQCFQARGDEPPAGSILSAVEKGRVDCVEWLLERFSYTKYLSAAHVIEKAASSGQVEVLQYFHGVDMAEKFHACGGKSQKQAKRQRKDEDKPWWPSCCSVANMAAENGHLAVLEWLLDHRWSECSPQEESSDVMNVAATNGHLEVVKWLHQTSQFDCSSAAMDGAAANGHSDVVQWLHENRTEGCTTKAMDDAARNGHLEVVKWLHAHRTEGCTANALDSAATEGRLDVVQWLWENRTEGCTTRAIDSAAFHRHDSLVRWLLLNTTAPCTTLAMDSVTTVETMALLQEKRQQPCTARALGRMVTSDNAAIVSWIFSNFPEAMQLMTESDYTLQFEVLLFLRDQHPSALTTSSIQHNARWRLDCIEEATGEIDVLGWLLDNFPQYTGGMTAEMREKRPDAFFMESLV